MDWVQLSIFRSIIVVVMILYIKYDNTPYIMFPIIINIIVGTLSLVYFILYYKEHFTNEFIKPKYYIYAFIALCMTVLRYYIIKICPNPAYFKVFVSLQIILLLLFTYIVNNNFKISMQTIIGLICGCASIILISLDENNK
jgi:drug/metabolite transporter (DMT)-like permease